MLTAGKVPNASRPLSARRAALRFRASMRSPRARSVTPLACKRSIVSGASSQAAGGSAGRSETIAHTSKNGQTGRICSPSLNLISSGMIGSTRPSGSTLSDHAGATTVSPSVRGFSDCCQS